MAKNRDIPGIIPLIDSDLPEHRRDRPAWYAMPLAIPASTYLKGKSAPEIVQAFVPLADTLAELHERKISHRDIKPQNILALDNRLCLSDFGLVKYPDREQLTPLRSDVGAKFTMAPEMRRFAASADGIPADVFSFAKSLWIALTGRELGFDGQYNAASDIALNKFLSGIYTTKLDELLRECTDNDPLQRPTMTQVKDRLQEWLGLLEDFDKRNQVEWTEILQILFPLGAPERAAWTDIDSICIVLNAIGKIRSLNHMFYPDGGGNTITRVSRAGEDGFIQIKALGTAIVKPLKLTFESFGVSSFWNYFRLEADVVEETGIDDTRPGDYREYLTEIEPGNYGPIRLWDDAGYEEGEQLPKTARPVARYLRGSFVIFSTRSPYNLDSSTYDGRHAKMNEDAFREYIKRNALRDR